MGTLIAREAPKERFDVTGAVAAQDDPGIGKTLRELGAGDSDAKVSPPSSLAALLGKSDVCISFTSAQAEVNNLRTIVEGGVPYVSGTTGLTPQQRKDANAALTGKVPAVIASNFSVGRQPPHRHVGRPQGPAPGLRRQHRGGPPLREGGRPQRDRAKHSPGGLKGQGLHQDRERAQRRLQARPGRARGGLAQGRRDAGHPHGARVRPPRDDHPGAPRLLEVRLRPGRPPRRGVGRCGGAGAAGSTAWRTSSGSSSEKSSRR